MISSIQLSDYSDEKRSAIAVRFASTAEQMVVAQVQVDGEWRNSHAEPFSTTSIDRDDSKDGIGTLAFVVDGYLVPAGKQTRKVTLSDGVQYSLRIVSVANNTELDFDAGSIKLDRSKAKGH